MRATKAAKPPIEIPYNDKGRYAFEVFTGIAERLWELGKNETADFCEAEMPRAVTTGEFFEDAKFYRTLKTQGGKQKTVIYDYRAKTVTVTKEMYKCKKPQQVDYSPQSAYVAVGSYAVSAV